MSINISWLEEKFFKRTLSESEKSALSSMKEYKHRQSERIIEQDQPGGKLYILYAGKLGVEVTKKGVRNHLLDVEEGGIVGEMSFLSSGKSKADVIAMENSVVYVLSKEDFETIMNDEHQLAYDIFQRILESTSHTILNLDYKLLPFLKVVGEKVKSIPLFIKLFPVIFIILYVLAFFYFSWKDFAY